MDDRELLEMTARAAGVNVWTDIDGKYYSQGVGIAEVPWDPLTDDGDALRLAVKLRLSLTPVGDFLIVSPPGQNCVKMVSADYGDDPYAATRRAIVRAAAELARAGAQKGDMTDMTDRLNAIKALALRDLDSTSDEQIRAEFIEDKQDPSEVAHKVAASLARVAERTAVSQHAMTAIDAQRAELYALEVKHAELVDQFEAMRQQRDALRKRVDLLELLLRFARPYAKHGAVRYHDGTNGSARRDEARDLVGRIDAALKTTPATP